MTIGLNPGGLLGCFVALMLIINSIVKMDRERFFADDWSSTLARRCNASIYYSLYLIGGAFCGNLLFDRLTQAVVNDPRLSALL